MKDKATLIAVALVVTACGGGGGSSTSPAPVPPASGTPPAVSPPVTTPPVIVPPVVAPPVVVPPVVAPVMAACAAPTTTQQAMMWGQTPMKAICAGVYIEPGATADEELYQRQSVAYAAQQITAYYGVMTVAQPDIILCKTQACRTYFMGTISAALQVGASGVVVPGATYKTQSPTIFVTYTSFLAFGRNTVVHELAHAEFGFRIAGGMGAPAWFNEGQATLIGKDPDCTGVTVNGTLDLTRLDNGADWIAATTGLGAAGGDQGTRTYCQAQREVTAWVTKNGQPKYLALLASIKAGTPFYSAYGALLTQ